MYFKNFPRVQYDILGDGETRTMIDLTSFTAFNLDRLDGAISYTYYNIEDGDRPDNVSFALYGSPDYHWTFFLVNPHLRNYYDHWPKGSHALSEMVKIKYPHIAGLFNTNQVLAGKFKIGEIVTGQQSRASGYVRAKYPTDGYIVIEPFIGKFKESGESIVGAETEDALDCDSFVQQYNAPHHHVNDFTGDVVEQGLSGTTAISFYEWEVENNNQNSKIKVIRPEIIRTVVGEFIRELNK